MSHPLNAIWEKIKRAEEHIKNLNNEITTFLTGNVYRIIGDAKADTREHVLRIFGPDPPIRFSVIAGESIHQCRSALDHLIGKLVIANNGTPDHRHEFPICDTPNKFKEACERRKIQGLTESAANIIKSIQPYNNPKGFEWDQLRVLHDMDITDKHKLLMVVIASASLGGSTFNIDGGQPNVSIVGFSEPKWPARPTKDGTEILSIKLGAPAPNMKVDVQPTVQIAFEKYGLLSGEPVINCLDQLKEVTVHTISKFIPELRGAHNPSL